MKTKDKITIYSIGHKQFWQPRSRITKKLFVGGAKGAAGDLRDDVGENIADKNPCYNEMTGLYWVWKNDKESTIVGIQHYRRIFVRRKWKRFEFLPKPIDKKFIEAALSTHDVIVPTRFVFSLSCGDRIRTDESAIRPEDISIIEEAIRSHSPDYVGDWRALMKSNDPFLLNMFVMRRALVREYCEWVFPILFELENRTNPWARSGNERRLMGLASEYLFDVWVNHKKLKVFECEYIVENNFRKKLKLIWWLRGIRRHLMAR